MKKKFQRILVIGSDGMLGYAVSSYFKSKKYKVSTTTRETFDILRDPIDKLTYRINVVDLVVNCAGVIKPRINNFGVEDILKINGIFPWNLAKLCVRNKTPCIHITTDCVYSGRKGNYKENDYVDAKDLYGLSKSAGDVHLCMTLRTSIIGEEINQKRSLLEWIKASKGKKVNAFINHIWNGVTTIYLAEIIEKIINRNLYKPGIYHIFSKQPISKYELLSIINKIYRTNLNIIRYKSPTPINRSLSSIYKLSSKVSTKSLKQQIKELKVFFDKNQ